MPITYYIDFCAKQFEGIQRDAINFKKMKNRFPKVFTPDEFSKDTFSREFSAKSSFESMRANLAFVTAFKMVTRANYYTTG